jgi:hypothetical protein
MALLDSFLPTSEVHEVDHVAVRASPEATWSAVRAVDLYRIPFVRDLFAIRLLPDRIVFIVSRSSERTQLTPAPSACRWAVTPLSTSRNHGGNENHRSQHRSSTESHKTH